MKKLHVVPSILVIVSIVLGMFAAACTGSKPAATPASTSAQATGPIVIKVGLPTPLTGPASPWGQAGETYYPTWISLFNKAGGFKVNGQTYNFELVTVDSMFTPEGDAAATKQLIYSEKCKAIAGYWGYSYQAVSAVTTPAKAIFICRNANEAVPGGLYNPAKEPLVAFGTPSHEQMILSYKAFVKAFPNYKKIGRTDASMGESKGVDLISDALKEANIRFDGAYYAPGTTDFTPLIQKLVVDMGCDVIWCYGDVGSILAIMKQRWEMGFKNVLVVSTSAPLSADIYNNIAGYDAAQGFLGSYADPNDYKINKVDQKWIDMYNETNKIVSEKAGKTLKYAGWYDWLPVHLAILSQAMEKAGTVDDSEAIMKQIRGGTFNTPNGTYTMSGAKSYGSPVVFGTHVALGQIKGHDYVYLSEAEWENLP